MDTPERARPYRRDLDLFRATTQLAAYGAAIMLAAGCSNVINAVLSDETGGITVKEPVHPTHALTDDELNIVSWNLFRKMTPHLASIRQMAGVNSVDAFLFQEVGARGFQILVKEFSNDWGIVWDMADPEPIQAHETLGNVVMTRGQKLRDIRRKDMPGSSLVTTTTQTVTGAVNDAYSFDTSGKRTKAGFEENRTIIAGSFYVRDQGKLRDVRLSTTHISKNEMAHQPQLDEATSFLNQDTQEDRPTVFCGDLNHQATGEVTGIFSRLRYITLHSPSNHPTHKDGGVIDYCTYFDAKTLATNGIGKLRILSQYKSSDHFPLLASWKLGDPNETSK